MSLEHRAGRPKPWLVRWRDGSGRSRSASFATRREAERAQAGLIRGQAPAARSRGPSLAEWLDRWMRVYGPTWAPGTRTTRTYVVRGWLVPLLGAAPLAGIGRSEITALRAAMLEQGASPTRTNRALRDLSAALSVAVDEGLLERNPCLGLRALRTPPPNREPVPIERVEALRAAMLHPHDRLVVSLMAYAGCRLSEALLISPHPVRLDAAGCLPIFSPKTNRWRRVPCSAAIIHDATRAAAVGLPWTAQNWRQNRFLPARPQPAPGEHALTPHLLRHTFASEMLRRGVPVLTVASWLGHSRASLTTDVYGHVLPAVAAPLDAVVRTARTVYQGCTDWPSDDEVPARAGIRFDPAWLHLIGQ